MRIERDVKEKVKAMLNRYGAYWFMPATAGYGRSGVPDLVGCINGKFFAVECKYGTNKPSALQSAEIFKIQSRKGVASVINETNLDLLEVWLKEQALDAPMTVPATGTRKKLDDHA